MNTHVKLSDILDFSSKENCSPKLVISKKLNLYDGLRINETSSKYDKIGYINSDKISYGYLFCLLTSQIMKFIYGKKDLNLNKNVQNYIRMKVIKSLPIKVVDLEIQKKFDIIYSYMMNYDDKTLYLKRLSNAMLYDIYFPWLSERGRIGNCEILKYLDNLPELDNLNNEQKQEVIEKEIKRQRSSNSPIAISMFRMDCYGEIRYIERGLDKDWFNLEEFNRALGL